MFVSRNANAICSLYLLNPVISDTIDKSPTTTFQILDLGDTAVPTNARSLIAEGKYVVAIQGKSVVFSGIIRRASQNTQSGFSFSTHLKLWDIECDSDLMRLAKLNVPASALTSDGSPIVDSPGYIARRILEPASGEADWRGVIYCQDPTISYQLNSTDLEDVGSQYDQMITLRDVTNYDLITRRDWTAYLYDSYDPATGIITISNETFDADELIGFNVVFVNEYTETDNTAFSVINPNYYELQMTTLISMSVGDSVYFTTTGTLPSNYALNTIYYVTWAGDLPPLYDLFTISATPGGSDIKPGSYGTGTHTVHLGTHNYMLIPNAYGTISDNDATTITLTTPNGGLTTVHRTSDYMILLKDPKIDFAPDLATPSDVVSLDVNSDVFEYNDNDDKRKLSTKVIVKGKDLQGKPISVGLVACHEYDNDKQFFEDSTYVTKKSEGYVYKNNMTGGSSSVTSYPPLASKAFTTDIGTDNKAIYVADTTGLHIGMRVGFSVTGGSLPNPIHDYTVGYYYVQSIPSSTKFYVTATYAGSAITLTTDYGAGGTFVTPYSGFEIDNDPVFLALGDAFLVSASVMPSSLSTTTVYYCITNIGTTADEFFEISTTIGGSAVSFGYPTAGTDVVITKVGSSGSGTITADVPTVWLYGHDYLIYDGSLVYLTTPPNGAVIAYTTDGDPSEGIDANGVKYTSVVLTTWPTKDYSYKGFFLNSYLHVMNADAVGNNDVLIGEEPFTITSHTHATSTYIYDFITNNLTRGGGSGLMTEKCYPHGVGALVARTNYTEAAPDANSPLGLYGLTSTTTTVDSNLTYGDLDAYATSLLLGFGAFYKKATCWAPIITCGVKRAGKGSASPSTFDISTPPRVGDTVEIIEYSGADAQNFEVVGLTIKYDEGKILLELGDYEKNIFTSLQQSTNGVNRTLT
jgi:hypothetical protein